MPPLDLSVIILTHNEQQHIERCITSVRNIAASVYVIDCFSADRTREIAVNLGAEVYEHAWVNYATQFNWAIENLPISTSWILRLDADEIVTSELQQEMHDRLSALADDITGVYIKRRIVFMGKWIQKGDMYPVYMLRLWRRGLGFCEKRWMDEHIKITKGRTESFKNDIIDQNLNNLTWWVSKHNSYASREAVDLLNLKYGLIDHEGVVPELFGMQEQRKRWLKIRYANLPFFLRPFLYFLYRYILRLGFVDGKEGLVYHFLQGFWYRFLVDAKLFEIQQRCGSDRAKIVKFLKTDCGIDLSAN